MSQQDSLAKAQSQILPSGGYQHASEVRRLAATLLGMAATMHWNGYLHGDVTAGNVPLVERAAAADGGSCSFVVIDMGLPGAAGQPRRRLRKRPAGFSLQTAPPELFAHAMLGKHASAPVGIGAMVAQAAALHSMYARQRGAGAAVRAGQAGAAAADAASLADLLAGLTAQRPEDRLTAEAALAHPFFRE
ncbi:hypothetical protein HYH02_009206 [Chlamydomonas schloesseri]|uniref:Protein kinase domain-containing protein n=1 Tax=Chlamydomonas schloesseri TaxID=2026947 RepID=A0A836B0F4_9CHLO|nr:hypothetical protein HYH02_009206 [Chlamydomonas schloesseri]|eukprot:KAG2444006.1 hypothetical protein HYH02_009206 [Chlamydomonas schloesseri]